MPRLTLVLFSFLVLSVCVSLAKGKKGQHDVDFDDNEFAEFEDEFDEDGVVQDDEDADFPEEAPEPSTAKPQTPKKAQQEAADDEYEEEDEEDGILETEDDEFEHLADEDEFEGFDRDRDSSKSKSQDVPDLQIAKVPLHLRTNWDSFYLEMLMLAGLGVYFLNFLAGKTKNGKLAQAWLSSHRDLLDANFSIVGDDGTTKEAQSGTLMKESEHVYALWCSGRTCVEGMLVELKLLKRQDLINVMANLFKPVSDQIVVTVDMDSVSLDKFCFAIAQKKICAKLHREQNDLAQFTEKKNLDKLDVPSCFQVLSEIGEVTNAILDKKVCQVLKMYKDQIEYIHISDQFSGVKNQEETTQAKMPETKSVMIFCFNVAGKGKSKPADMEAMKPLFQLVFYCIDKVSRMMLSKEGRMKAEKNRQKAEEVFLKSAHVQRQEAAQQRREEKKRLEKERMMNEEDPDKTRKWEERENKKDMKRKLPKMKMMKV